MFYLFHPLAHYKAAGSLGLVFTVGNKLEKFEDAKLLDLSFYNLGLLSKLRSICCAFYPLGTLHRLHKYNLLLK